MPPRICRICNVPVNLPRAKYCSAECKKKHSNISNRLRRQDTPPLRARKLAREAFANLFKECPDAYSPLIGCSISELKGYLENLFSDGMSWDNRGMYGWHIDHVKPCASFDLTNEEEVKKCFHYTNLQPLWARDNFVKGSKTGDGKSIRLQYKDPSKEDIESMLDWYLDGSPSYLAFLREHRKTFNMARISIEAGFCHSYIKHIISGRRGFKKGAEIRIRQVIDPIIELFSQIVFTDDEEASNV